jgi:molecular chaperone DnaK (HSP70)
MYGQTRKESKKYMTTMGPATMDRRRRRPYRWSVVVSALWVTILWRSMVVPGYMIRRPRRSIPSWFLQRRLREDNDLVDDGIGVGIDLGTTNSAVAYLNEEGIPTIIPIPHNGRTMPSIVVLLQDTNGTMVPIVGKQALLYRDDAADHWTDDNCIYRHVKRVIGTGGKLAPDIAAAVPMVQPSPTGKTYHNYNLPNQIDDSIHHPTLLRRRLLRPPANTTSSLPTDVERLSLHPGDEAGPFLRPEFLSACVLHTLRCAAEQATQRRVTRAVLGVPAYFHDGQRNATVAAARRAGFAQVQLLREPEAAALAYGRGKRPVQRGPLSKEEEEEELVLVFDLGGGTYDVSILSVDGPLTEVVCTSGNAQLGGSVWDAKLARHFYHQWAPAVPPPACSRWPDVQHHFLLAAEAMRIHLSNHREVQAAFPVQDWSAVRRDPASVILRNPATRSESALPAAAAARTNGTHVFLQLTRREMDQLCAPEMQAILRPLREVAILAGALLPGDSSPAVVAAARDDRATDPGPYDDFYPPETVAAGAPSGDGENDGVRSDLLSTLPRMKDSKKLQQRGRKRARDLAKEERQYRQEKKSIGSPSAATPPGSRRTPKVRDGIAGRPISRIVLVGGATRMSCIGRLLTAVTGVVPQTTVNPDEAVALGCAVQVGRLDGREGMGTVLTPMQAAIVRAMALSAAGGTSNRDFLDEDDDDEEEDALDSPGAVY